MARERERMPKKKLRVISAAEAKTRGVLVSDNPDPNFVFFKGTGSLDLVCGKCGRRLGKKLEPGSLDNWQNAAIKCPGCGAVNEVGPVVN